MKSKRRPESYPDRGVEIPNALILKRFTSHLNPFCRRLSKGEIEIFTHAKRGLLFILAAVILSQCSKYDEPAPFFDGLFLEYIRETGSKKREITFNVEAVTDNEFQITVTRIPQLIGEKIDTIQVDHFGRVFQSTIEIYQGKFSPIWIPVSKMKIGDKFDGRKKVVEEEHWKDWNVLVVKDTATGALDYFDIRTGFHVGAYVKTPMGLVEEILVNTNADIPVAESE